MEYEVVKHLRFLFRPVDESLELLHKIDKKIDMQASSRLKGQLVTLELLSTSKKQDQTTYKICLNHLNDLIEFYKDLTDQTIKEYNYMGENIKSFSSFVINSWKKLGRKALEKPVLKLTAIANYSCLRCLSEAGAIICLVKLKYPSQVIEERKHRLASFFTSVMDFIERDGWAFLHALPDYWEEQGSLSDRLMAVTFAYTCGKNALHNFRTGYEALCGIAGFQIMLWGTDKVLGRP